jgi:hypothetical protein
VDDRLDDREVLKVVRPRIGVSRVVRRQTVLAEVDRRAVVAIHRVPANRVARGGGEDEDPAARRLTEPVEGDEISGARRAPSDEIAVSALDENALVEIPHGERSGDVGADEVSLDHVAGSGERELDGVDVVP